MTLARLSRAHHHPLARAFALASALVLLVGLVLVGVHQHDRSDASHPCAICSLGHAPATAPVVAIGCVPAPHVERVLVERVLAPRGAAVVTATSRAPPSA